jgi:hypothetical protein
LRAARATHSVRVAEGEERHHADLPLLGERQKFVLGEAIAHVVVDADKVDRLVSHDRLDLGGLRFHHDRLHGDIPDAPRLLLFLQGREGRLIGCGRQHDQVDPGHLEPRQQRIDVRLHEVGLQRDVARGSSRRPEKLVLNPELGGRRDVELLRRRADVHRVVDSASPIGKRLEDLRERGVIRAPRVVTERESEGRDHLASRRNGPLNELPARLLKCAEQLGTERQRSAGAKGGSKELATVDRT